MKLLAFTDGASRGNPGESGIGVLLKDKEGNVIDSLSAYIGKATNNTAEYVALISGLRLVMKHPCCHLVVHSDSELLVRQLNGKYKVKNELLKHYYEAVQKLLQELNCKVTFCHIPREQNAEADALANKGIDEKKNIISSQSLLDEGHQKERVFEKDRIISRCMP